MSFGSMLRGLTEQDVRFVVIGGLASAAHGSGRVTDDLDICYDAESDNVDRLALLLATWRAVLRGVDPTPPFIMDGRTLRAAPVLTLSTSEGAIDVLDRVAGVGGYAAALAGSLLVEAFDTRFRVLDLPALIASKRAAGRPKDQSHLPELEALLALRDDRPGAGPA